MAVCKKCGHNTEKRGLFCPRCGNSYSQSVGEARAKSSLRLRGLALTSMGICAIVLLTCGLILYNTLTYKPPSDTADDSENTSATETVMSDKLPSPVEGVSLYFYEESQSLLSYVRDGGLEEDITAAYHDVRDFKQVSNDLRNQLDQLDLLAKSGGESTYARVVRKVSNAYRDHLITMVTKSGSDPAAVDESQIVMDVLWADFDNALTREQVSALL